jgi:tRNA(fMet)-specific endonuclease VapC
MKLLIDTNRYGDLVANDLDATARLQNADEAWISAISVGELLGGFELGSKSADNRARLSSFLGVQGVGVLTVDDTTAERYGVIFAELRRAGTPIPTNDIWIAALAIQHNLVLDTRDAHFQHVAGLHLV